MGAGKVINIGTSFIVIINVSIGSYYYKYYDSMAILQEVPPRMHDLVHKYLYFLCFLLIHNGGCLMNL